VAGQLLASSKIVSMSFFETNSDVYADSFGNPINVANMNPGWGMDPSLMTPSYTAPYRPQYSGYNGYQNWANPGMMQAAVNIFGPARHPNWTMAPTNIDPSVTSLATKPIDAIAWGIQNVGAPVLGYYAASKVFGTGAKSILGEFPAMWRGRGIAAGMGVGAGRGLAKSLGLRTAQTGLAPASMMARGMMGFGGVAAGVALPLAIGTAITNTINAGVIDPYVNSRGTAKDLRSNFSGVYFGDASGHPVTGQGLGGREASQIGYAINRMGMKDMLYGAEDYREISDLSARAGLMDTVQSKQISKRVKDVAEILKFVQAVSGEIDRSKVIEVIASLQQAGASVAGGRSSAAFGAYQGLNYAAAGAGASISKIMNTVGMQGQYLFQANGMTPYLGQLAAANTYAGFSAAQRSGLLSPAILARAGGLEGISQSALTAQVEASQTTFNQWASVNKYLLGAQGGAGVGAGMNPMDTLTYMGRYASRDPGYAAALMDLAGPAAAGKSLEEMGSLNAQEQAVGWLKQFGIMPAGKDGRYDGIQISQAMAHMGISSENRRNYILQRAAEQDEYSVATRLKANEGEYRKQIRLFAEQNLAGAGPFQSIARWGKKKWIGATTSLADAFSSPMINLAGTTEDSLAEFSDYWNYGKTITDSSISVKQLEHDLSVGASLSNRSVTQVNMPSLIDTGDMLSSDLKDIFTKSGDKGGINYLGSRKLVESLNELAMYGGNSEIRAAAEKVLSSKGADRKQALYDFIKNHKNTLDPSLLDRVKGGGADSMSASLDATVYAMDNKATTFQSSTKTTRTSVDEFTSRIQGMRLKEKDSFLGLGWSGNPYLTREGTDNMDAVLAGGAAGRALEIQRAKQLSPAELKKLILTDPNFASLRKAVDIESLDDEGLIETLRNLTANSQANGSYGASVVAFDTGFTFKEGATEKEKLDALSKHMSINGVPDIIGSENRSAHNLNTDQLIDAGNMSEAKIREDSDILRRYRKGDVDYESAATMLKKLDPADRFNIAVDKFGVNVDKMNGKEKKEPPEASRPSIDQSRFKDYQPGSRINQQTSTDNKGG
jgi:hypothetical protein